MQERAVLAFAKTAAKSNNPQSHKKYRRTFCESEEPMSKQTVLALLKQLQRQSRSELVAGAGFEPATSGL